MFLGSFSFQRCPCSCIEPRGSYRSMRIRERNRGGRMLSKPHFAWKITGVEELQPPSRLLLDKPLSSLLLT